MSPQQDRPLSGMILSTVFTFTVMVAGVVIVALSTYEWLEGRLETAGLAAGVVVGLILAIILGAKPLWNEYFQSRLRGR